MPHSTLNLTSKAQLKALTSPGRTEIITALQALGPATVAALAERMGRKAASLYYHVHSLERAGILRVKERVREGRRSISVYELSAERIELDHRLLTPRTAPALSKMGIRLLRKAEREYSAALTRSAELSSREQPQSIFVARMRGRLSARSLSRVMSHLSAIQALFRSEMKKPAGELFALTAAFAPLPSPKRRS